ncbi:MAG: DNA polymerase III subunit [Flavobacteriaceae bacterium]|nr:DNA polymerase III subunit [Flavobacteriaceae bacterium]
MFFDEILGHQHLKQHLKHTAKMGRIPHAQLFVGPEGSGVLPMAIAYAAYVLCERKEDLGQKEACRLKITHFNHPDLHFVFPVNTNDRVKKNPLSNDFLEEWRAFLNEQIHGNLFDWYRKIGIEKKQGRIGVDEAKEILAKLKLKSFESGYKIMLIWMAERLNPEASNKLLKLIEEPQDNTLILLLAEDENQILPTIRSRCQAIHFPAFTQTQIKNELINRFNIAESLATNISHRSNGNINKALDLMNEDSEDLTFERWFVYWVRAAFRAKGNKAVVNDLLGWSDEIAKTGRETQKHFLQFCIQLFRQAMLWNYGVKDLVFMKMQYDNFQLEKFAAFVHEANILEITKSLEDAIYHIERNGNAKVILTDLSLSLTRLLHSKAV